MKAKTFAKLLGAATFLAAASSAQAISFNLPIPGGDFLLSDNSAEILIKGAGNTNPDAIEVGDVLHGIFIIDDISGKSILAGSGFDELSGVFETKVLSITGGPGGVANPFIYTFGANNGSAFTTAYGAGATVAYFTDPTHEYQRETNSGQTAAQLEALITDGSLFWVAGFVDGDNFWNASSRTNDPTPPGTVPNTAFGQYQWGLDLITNNSGLQFNQVDCLDESKGIFGTTVKVDQCGNGQILTPNPASGFTTPFPVWDDQNISMNRIPEPASLALLGLGLLGLGVSRKTKKNA